MDSVSSADIILFDTFSFDRRGRGLFYVDDRAPVAVGSRALDVLSVLIERAGDLVPKHEIMEAVWPETTVEEANLTVHISTLRRVLDNGRSQTSCIQTIPGRGYRFVGEVIKKDTDARSGVGTRELRNVRTAQRLSIVVLPFSNLSDDREQQYFADGITEDLTTDLSALPGLLVISRNTAFTYKSKTVDAKQIGRELAVRYLLEGSVRRSGNQMRVNVQLIDAESNTHLWAERFDHDTGDLFALQNEITGLIANSLNVTLTRSEAGRYTENPDALDYLLRARAVASRPNSWKKYVEAIGLYERALTLDPQSVETRGRLAISLISRVLDEMTDNAAADIARAKELIDQALALSPGDRDAHYAKGQLLRFQRRCAEAIPEYEIMLASIRNHAGAMFQIATCKVSLGFSEEAIPLLQRAIRLNPGEPNIYLYYQRLGQAHLLQSRIDEAIVWLEKARGVHPGIQFVHANLAAAYGLKGDIEHAVAEVAEARRLGGAGFMSSIAQIRRDTLFQTSALALYEATFLAGYRKAGVSEE